VVKIRSDNKVYREVKKPAAVYDFESGLLKIGEEDEMKKYYEVIVKSYEFLDMPQFAATIRFIRLPDDQQLIDKIFNISGFICRIEKILGSNI
jgi:hypothetical protein